MPKGVVHSHGSALGAVRSSLAPRCIDADTRLYLPMPFFWVGGFGGGVLSALLAGATLVTEPAPQPETDAATAGARTGHAVPRLARPGRSPGPATQIRCGADLSSLRPGSLEALLPPDKRGRTGRARQAVRHDRDVRPLLWLRRRHRHAEVGMGQLRQAVRRHGGSHRRRRHRTSHSAPGRSAIQICVGRTPCAASAAAAGRSSSPSTASTPPATSVTSTTTDSCSTTAESDDMFKVSGATVYPARSRRRCAHSTVSHGAYVTNVPGDQR